MAGTRASTRSGKAAAADLLQLAAFSVSATPSTRAPSKRLLRARTLAIRDRTIASSGVEHGDKTDEPGPKRMRGSPPKPARAATLSVTTTPETTKSVMTTPEKKEAASEAIARHRTAAKANLVNATPFKPKTITEVRDVDFVVGKTTYATRAGAEADMKAIAERDKKLITFSKGHNGTAQKDVHVLDALCKGNNGTISQGIKPRLL